MTPVIFFKNVGKKYNGRTVLSDISFAINKQDVVGLLGPSGVGKTTILKIAAGLENASSGRVEVSVGRTGYVFQEHRLFPWKTALENITLPMKAHGTAREEAEDKGRRHLQAMGLAEFTDYYPAQLSGGMKQRVSIARAFALEPDVLLLDEPFSALDLKLKNELLEMINQQLAIQEITVLYISHSPAEVKKIANRILMMTSTGELNELDDLMLV